MELALDHGVPALPRNTPFLARAASSQFHMASSAQRSNRAPFVLLGSLRGPGAVVGPDGPMPVIYEIDAFSTGRTVTASGSIEGDFSAWTASQDVTAQTPLPLALYLQSGHRLDLSIFALDADLAEFDLPGDAGLLRLLGPTAHHGFS